VLVGFLDQFWCFWSSICIVTYSKSWSVCPWIQSICWNSLIKQVGRAWQGIYF